MTLHQTKLTDLANGFRHESAEAVSEREERLAAIREELRDKGIMEKVDAARAARRLPARGSLRHKVLASRAQAHLDAGGCSGDFCPHCGGTGWAFELYDRNRATECRCYYCSGRGMGK